MAIEFEFEFNATIKLVCQVLTPKGVDGVQKIKIQIK
jgi:hypothetical protein